MRSGMRGFSTVLAGHPESLSGKLLSPFFLGFFDAPVRFRTAIVGVSDDVIPI
jgi:hypothetical protein